MTLYQFLTDQASRTSDSAISFTVLYAILTAVRAYTPKIITWLRTAKTDIKLSHSNGSGVDISIDPTSGAADVHIAAKAKKE